MPSANSPMSVDGPSAIDVALLDHFANLHQRTLVDAGVLVGTLEFLQRVNVHARFAGFDRTRCADNDTGGVDLIDNSGASCGDRSARVAGHGFFHAGADKRRFGFDQRHSLTLHVRSHQCAVGVIIFQERNERGGNRNKLLRAHVHQGDDVAWRHQEFASLTRRNEFLHKAAVCGQFGVRLRHGVLLLFHCGEIENIVGYFVIHDLPIWCFDESHIC